MRHLKAIWRKATFAVVAFVSWLAIYGAAVGAPVRDDQLRSAAKSSPGSGGGSYILPYTIAILSIGVAVFLVCRSSRRRDRARPEEYAQMFSDDGEVVQ